MTVERPEVALSPGRRLGALLAVAAARILATRRPARIRRVLARVAAHAGPAGPADVLAARQAVMAVSLTCRGASGCVPRSIATMLLCRPAGGVPTWCVGVRTVAPFGAHAWVEADGEMVGESVPPGYLRALLRVEPGVPAGTVPAGTAVGDGRW
ncbi:lasso peptide biosynthesis B2 protein [Frankia sp. AgB32]|uniref:lasso peptide biosynthesis B2 protein n=1 Tax=Frankia sp. AgB32 TaxID=631119 RepID=UPI00200C3227|nr:lasso peptide biosynthesis B2 protein [Frankia sp. AgB32]MCK9897617.1 lasso peptide biosynthesis B2 protein [Frankia sp. AgB32]